jgi:hypothetical protein
MSSPIVRIKRGTTNPTTLLEGELALNKTSKTLFIGDGSSNGTGVLTIGGEGAYVDKTSAQTIGGVKSFTETVVGSVNGNAGTATTLQTARDISLTGDVTGTASSFNGSANASISATLANSGVSAGTHTKVTVDAKGRVTVGANLEASDIPTLTASKISDFDTQVRTSRLDQMAAPSASVSLNSQKITGLADATSATDAANKGYVDSAISGLVNGAPEALNTLQELSQALGADANFATTVSTSIGTKLAKSSNLSDLANTATARENLGVKIGTDVQAYDAELAALAGLTSAADKVPYFTGEGTAGVTDFTSWGRQLVGYPDAEIARDHLGLGNMSLQVDDDVAITGGAISGVTLSSITIDCGTY